MQFSFKKPERLTSRKQINTLFKHGNILFIYPVKAYYIYSKNNSNSSNTVLFSVPKKNIRKAVERNRLKRQMREVYRNNKLLLNEKKHLNIGFIYTESMITSYALIKESLIKIMKNIK